MRTIRTYIELDLVEGKHFNPHNTVLTDIEAREEAGKSFIDWLDSWCQEESKDTINEYIQTRIIDN